MASKLPGILALTALLFTVSCEKTEEGGFIINNTSGGPIEVVVDGDASDLDIDETRTFTWDFTEDEDMDVTITASGMFVLNYEFNKYVWGSGELDEIRVTADASCVRIINSTGVSITDVYISSYQSNTWGTNFLDGSTDIANGSSRDFTIKADSYDLKIIDSNNTVYSKSWLDLPYFDQGILQEITIGS